MSSDDHDSVRATMFVRTSPEVAFEVFTREIDRWWQRGPRFRVGAGKSKMATGTMRLDGEALVETYDDGTSFELGRVRVWEPGARLVVGWRAGNFAPGESTEVEVTFRFKRDGDCDGTEVVLVHRGWAAIRADHPARHGLSGERFLFSRAMWWADLTRGFRALAEP